MGSTTGSIILMKKGKQVTAGITAPSNPKINEIWLDTAENANILKYWNGTSWIKVNDVSDEFSDIYETLRNNYYTRTETSNQIATQIGSATITTSDGTTINMKNALNEVIDTSMEHTQTISSMQSDIDKNENALNTLQTSVSTFTHDLDGFKLDVSKTYATKDEFDNLEIGGRNLVVQNTLTRNKYLTINGTEEESPYFAITDFIDIGDAKQLVYTTDNYGIAPSTCFYDENKNFIIGYSGENRKLLDVPNSAKYVRTTVPLAGLNVTKLEKGSIATDWTPALEDIEENINLVNTTLSNKYTSLQTDLSGFKTTVSSTYTTKTEFENLEIGATNILKNISIHTADNKLKLTAANDNYFEITNASVILEEGKQYTFSCKTDGIWGTGTDDTVEAYLLLNKQYQTFFRLDSNEKFTFIAPASGEYYLRIDVNKNGKTHSFWNFKIEEGNKSTSWSPCPTDINTQITTVETVANQTADKFNWLVKSGTSESNFMITDRLVQLTSKELNIDALTTFINSAKNGTSTVINGNSIGSGLIQSTNMVYIVDADGNSGENYTLKEGSILNLDDGSFISPNLTWDRYGNLLAKNATVTGSIFGERGQIGNWNIDPDSGSLYSVTKYGDTSWGTTYETGMRAANTYGYVDSYLDQWVFYSGYHASSDTKNLYPYFYIKTDGSAYFASDVNVYNLQCTKFLNNWETWSNGGLFTQKTFGTSTAGSAYCFWIEPVRDELGLDTKVLYGGTHATNAADKNYWDSLWYIDVLGNSLFDMVYATKYNTVSDRNKKHDIKELDEQSCVDIVCSLTPVSFKYDDTQFERNHWGFIAQDVEEMLNNLGITWQDYAVVDKSVHKEEVFTDVLDSDGNPVLDENGNPKREPKTIETDKYDYFLRYEAFIAPLVKTVQFQQKKINETEKEINELKTELNSLKELINKLNIG